MKDYVLIFIDYFGALEFFVKLEISDTSRKYVFLTTSLIAYKYLSKNSQVYFISAIGAPKTNLVVDYFDISEYRQGFCSRRRIKKLAENTINRYNSIVEQYKPASVKILVWNGSSVLGWVARYLQSKNSRLTLGFFEIANIPGKLFADPRGVNKRSALYECPDILTRLESVSDCPRINERSYFELKKVNEDRFTNSIAYWQKVVEALYQSTLGLRFFSLRKLLSTVIPRVLNYKVGVLCLNRRPEEYNLFPLQVRTDTQVVLNSKYNLTEAVQKILESSELPLIITPHPHDMGALKIISRLDPKFQRRIFVGKESTINYIGEAQKIFVINSTVGLDCLILGKNVEFIGCSFYSYFDKEMALKYVNDYLLSVNLRTRDPYSKSDVDSIYNHLDNIHDIYESIQK